MISPGGFDAREWGMRVSPLFHFTGTAPVKCDLGRGDDAFEGSELSVVSGRINVWWMKHRMGERPCSLAASPVCLPFREDGESRTPSARLRPYEATATRFVHLGREHAWKSICTTGFNG
jgi:hypothetical protein